MDVKRNKKVLIIGGGIAGMTAAYELSRLGAFPLIMEKGDFLGGHAIQFACKAGEKCQKCSACLVEERLKEVSENPDIAILLKSELKDLVGENGKFKAGIKRYPTVIDPQKCNDCGICVEQCPVANKGAIKMAYSIHNHPRYAIDKTCCLHFTKEKACTICQDACPNEAINLDRRSETIEERFGAIIVSTGFTPYNPRNKLQFGYGLHKNVVTALELEHILRREGRVVRPSDGKEPKKVAFIQCVGSRELKRPFCSRVCCSYALRLAEAIRWRQPNVRVTMFYIDIQTFGKDFLKSYEKWHTDVRLIRMIPGDIYQIEGDRLCISFMDSQTHHVLDEEFDMAILSIGIMPAMDNEALAEVLQIELDSNGFMATTDHLDNTKTSREGVYLAGTSQGPRDIADAVAHAGRAAWEAAKYIGA